MSHRTQGQKSVYLLSVTSRRRMLSPSLHHLIFDPFDVAPAQTFYLTPELEIATDASIVEDAKAIDDGDRMADGFNDLVRIEFQIGFMSNGKYQGINVF